MNNITEKLHCCHEITDKLYCHHYENWFLARLSLSLWHRINVKCYHQYHHSISPQEGGEGWSWCLRLLAKIWRHRWRAWHWKRRRKIMLMLIAMLVMLDANIDTDAAPPDISAYACAWTLTMEYLNSFCQFLVETFQCTSPDSSECASSHPANPLSLLLLTDPMTVSCWCCKTSLLANADVDAGVCPENR